MLANLSVPVPDALMRVMRDFREDLRPNKLDLGIGTYRDETGATPVLRAVKEAEQLVWSKQTSKAYLGPIGDNEFTSLLEQVVFGSFADRHVVRGVQTPGGTGAYRLGCELVRRCSTGARVLIGRPTWPNHEPIVLAVGLEVQPYGYFSKSRQAVSFDEMLNAILSGRPGDVALLQGCCHNPTGVDLSHAQWKEVAAAIARKRMIPFVDLAYQGIGDGFEEDARGIHCLLECCEELLVAVSCSKNFGLYRERTGALFVAARTGTLAETAQAHLADIARSVYSMPPDHGAAIVRTVLDVPVLRALWRFEVESMRSRIEIVRAAVAEAGSAAGIDLAHVWMGRGMFSLLDLDIHAVAALRNEHAIYVADNGRANIAGLRSEDAGRFAEALVSVTRTQEAARRSQ